VVEGRKDRGGEGEKEWWAEEKVEGKEYEVEWWRQFRVWERGRGNGELRGEKGRKKGEEERR